MNRGVKVAKVIAIGGFLVLLFSTYYLRSQVLGLNATRFSADNVKSDEDMKERKETYPVRVAEYEAKMAHYDIEMAHYREMLDLYKTNYDEYVIRKKFAPPKLPSKPKPRRLRSPEVSDKLAAINAEFRRQKYDYFNNTARLNWVACVAALSLIGSLLYLLMFDIEGKRIFYIAVLVLSFIFMIGPSFHSILSAIVGFLRPPGMY